MVRPSELTLSGFPHCAGGDVLIVLAPDKTFLLHAIMLRRHSSYFARELTLENATHLKRGLGLTIRYRFDLVERPENGGKGTGRFKRTEIDELSQPLSAALAKPDPHSSTLPNPIYTYYTLFFSALYGIPITLSTSIAELVLEADALIDIAEYLGSVHIISQPVEAALLRQGQTLFRSVASAPAAWCGVAVRGRMALVTEEAVRLLVGQWNRIPRREKDELPRCVWPLLEKKLSEFDKMRADVEREIINYHPSKLMKEEGTVERTNRTTYANDIYIWVTLAIFRAWFASELCSNKGRDAADGGWTFYTQIFSGNYLGKEDLSSWSDTGFAMNLRGLSVLAREMAEIKRDVGQIVAPLLENQSNLDTGKYPQAYLTCLKVGKVEVLRMLPTGPRVEAAEGAYYVDGKDEDEEERRMGLEETPGSFSGDVEDDEFEED